jgi:alkylhydroperoxidase family enzyme
VDAVCKDFETAPITDREKALFRYLAKVNDEPAKVDQAMVDTVLAAGWSDQAVFEAATVCALFNFFNRWIDSTGVEPPPPGLYEQRLEQQGAMGYTM